MRLKRAVGVVAVQVESFVLLSTEGCDAASTNLGVTVLIEDEACAEDARKLRYHYVTEPPTKRSPTKLLMKRCQS
jgi:hypothetical protein